MKNLFCIVFLLFVSMKTTFCQSQIGIQVGPSFSNMRIQGDGDLFGQPSNYTGIRAGVNYNYGINSIFEIQSGIYYNQTGFTVTQDFNFDLYNIDIPSNVRATTRMHFVEMPILLGANFGTEKIQFNIHAGPQIAYAMDADLLLRAKLILDFTLGRYDINLNNNNFRQLELSGVVGAGLKVKLNDRMVFHTGLNYMYGFTDLTSEPILNIGTRRQSINCNLGLSYTF